MESQDSIINRNYIVFGGMPTDGVMPDSITLRTKSILSADCYAINKSTRSRAASRALLTYLAKPLVQRKFCKAIPDAGFPAHSVSVSDAERDRTLYRKNVNTYFFYLQTLNSICIPQSECYYEAERIFEEEIMNALYGKSTPKDALHSAQLRIAEIENSPYAKH